MPLASSSCENVENEAIDFSVYSTPAEKAEALAVQFPGLSISVAKGDDIIWDWSTGFVDIQSQTPVITNTLFNIYSVSKMLSGMAFARLHGEDALPVGTKIRSIDVSLSKLYDAITVEHLLSHRSGLRHYKRGGLDEICETPLSYNKTCDCLFFGECPSV